ncbi:MAG TPA: alpha/beta fold hydrolase [Gemmatimonadaceae bacterium]|jgi:pimeloyl-ACP methyl ester carboxylesterase|nr:alpha/beta fold hydrolase [Gemmatimonadaceae bacterium]
MLRRQVLAALTLGGIAGLAACNDSFAFAPADAFEPDLEKVPGDDAEKDDIQEHVITGGAGCQLHVVETGNRRGRSILFIHGISQSVLTWRAQLRSELRRRYRLVAMDLRGHGASAKPAAGYEDSKLWADDVAAVIHDLSLEQPVLCGWSYGPLVMLDYLRHYGESRIGGLHFVDGLSKLGSAAAFGVLTPEVLALVPGLFATDTETSVAALDSLIRLFFVHTPSAAELYTILGYNVSVPPFVRQAMFSRTLDNDDLLPTIRKPLLLTHGAADAIVKVEVVEQIRQLVPHAEVQIMPNAGHAPFRDDASSFNRRLSAFADEV